MNTNTYTILKYERVGGIIRPKVIRKNEKNSIKSVYEIETAKIIKEGYKLISFVGNDKEKQRVFRKKNHDIILKMLEVLWN